MDFTVDTVCHIVWWVHIWHHQLVLPGVLQLAVVQRTTGVLIWGNIFRVSEECLNINESLVSMYIYCSGVLNLTEVCPG